MAFGESNIRYSAVRQNATNPKGMKEQLSPFNPGDEKHQVAIDLGTVDESVNVAGVDGLSHLKTGSANAITCCNRTITSNTTKSKIYRPRMYQIQATQ